jgi:hypothetical protein
MSVSTVCGSCRLLGACLLLALTALPARAARDEPARPSREVSVAQGLRWLSKEQSADGTWGKGESVVPETSLAVLAFLGAGVTPKDGAKKGAQGKAVALGAKALLARRGRDGTFAEGRTTQALATLALCETYALTSDPNLKLAAQSALNQVVKSQDIGTGGWSEKAKGTNELSVTAWQIMALRSGQMAGLTVPQQAFRRAEKFLDAVEVKGPYADTVGGKPSPTATAQGLLCRIYLGTGPRNPRFVAGLAELKKTAPGKSASLLREHFAVQVLHLAGSPDRTITDYLLSRQRRDGSWSKLGPAAAPWNTPVAQTALAVMSLEVYYAHRPLFRRSRPLPE